MSHSQQPGSAHTQPGTPEVTVNDVSTAGAAVLPAPPAHAPDLDGMETTIATWSVSGSIAATPGDAPDEVADTPVVTASWAPLAVPNSEAAPAPAVAAVDVSIRPSEVRFFGPVGRRRSPWMVVTVAVLTLGVSALRWHLRVNREMADFDPRMTVRPRRSLLAVAIPYATAWSVAIVAALRIAAWHLTPQTTFALSVDVADSLLAAPLLIPYVILLVPFSLVAVVRTAERVRILEDRVDVVGVEQLRPLAVTCWLLVPVVGGLVAVATLQRRLNGIYARVRPR